MSLGCSWLLSPVEKKNSFQSLSDSWGVKHILFGDFISLRLEFFGYHKKMIIVYVELVE